MGFGDIFRFVPLEVVSQDSIQQMVEDEDVLGVFKKVVHIEHPRQVSGGRK